MTINLDRLKFYLTWVHEEDFKHIINSNWKSFESSLGHSATSQILQNIQLIKPLVREWAKKRMDDRGNKIKEVENKLSNVFYSYGGLVHDDHLLFEVKRLKELENKLLLHDELEWSIKIRET